MTPRAPRRRRETGRWQTRARRSRPESLQTWTSAMTCRVRRFLTILALADPASANLAQRIRAHAYAKVKTLQMRHRPDWPKAEQFTRFSRVRRRSEAARTPQCG